MSKLINLKLDRDEKLSECDTLYLVVRKKNQPNVYVCFFIFFPKKINRSFSVKFFCCCYFLIKTTGTEIVCYNDISNSITKNSINHYRSKNIKHNFLTKQIGHSEYLWHKLNDNRFPRERYFVFQCLSRKLMTNFLLALILCNKLGLNIFARFSVFIFSLIFRKAFSRKKKQKISFMDKKHEFLKQTLNLIE